MCVCVCRWETLGSLRWTALSAASVTATTMSPASLGSAALHRSVKWLKECWTVTRQVTTDWIKDDKF